MRGPNSSEQQNKNQRQRPLLFWLHDLNTSEQQSNQFSSGKGLVRHVDTEFRWRDKVFPGTLCDHHASLLVEHGSDLWWRLRGGQILSCLRVLAALEVIGHVTVFPQKRKELQQEVAEVLADAKPPYDRRKIRTAWNLTVQQLFITYQLPYSHKKYIINRYKVYNYTKLSISKTDEKSLS